MMSESASLTMHDASASLDNLKYAMTEWTKNKTQDVLLYMIGDGDTESFHVNQEERLSANQLGEWLNTLQESIKVIVIYDAHQSGSFLEALEPSEGKERILIFSSGKDQQACFDADGDISFSRFFWSDVLDGANVKDAFENATKRLPLSTDHPVEPIIFPPMKEDDDITEYTIGFGTEMAPNEISTGSLTPGDINGNDAVDLADAVLALRSLTGMDDGNLIPNYANSGADVNGDGKIGLEEVIHILKEMLVHQIHSDHNGDRQTLSKH